MAWRPGRGEQPGLAHSATEHLPPPVGTCDERLRPDEHASHRCSQPLRKADRYGIERGDEGPGITMSGDRCVEQASSVHVVGTSTGTSDGSDLRQDLRVIARPTTAIRCVLHANERGVRIMPETALLLANGGVDLLCSHQSVLPLDQSDGAP